MKEQDLKPCPFCGGSDIEICFNRGTAHLWCDSCGAEGPHVDDSLWPLDDATWRGEYVDHPGLIGVKKSAAKAWSNRARVGAESREKCYVTALGDISAMLDSVWSDKSQAETRRWDLIGPMRMGFIDATVYEMTVALTPDQREETKARKVNDALRQGGRH